MALLPGEEGKKRAEWDTDKDSRGKEGFAKLAYWRRDRLRNRILLRRALVHY